MTRLPILPTLIVLVAAVTMVALGVWQLGRAEEKDALIAGYGAAGSNPERVAFPTSAEAEKATLYRHSAIDCGKVLSNGATGARSADDRGGWAQEAVCAIPGGKATVLIGWMNAPQVVPWDGGTVSGTIAPAGKSVKLVADPPLAGLEPLARPDPSDIPDNHLAYAVQWFFFAITAVVIYALTLRPRMKARDKT